MNLHKEEGWTLSRVETEEEKYSVFVRIGDYYLFHRCIAHEKQLGGVAYRMLRDCITIGMKDDAPCGWCGEKIPDGLYALFVLLGME